MKDAARSGGKPAGKGGRAPGKKKPAVQPGSRGLDARKLAAARPPAPVTRLAETIADDGGAVLGIFRDPLGGNWQILAGLPIERVEPTPYQRDLSAPHVARLAAAIDKLDRFLDPVIAVRTDEGQYWTPNGHHRLGALRELGSKSITALVVPEQKVARRILILNTEKAHNLRERALEVIRLAQALAELDPRPERDFATEFEEPALLTLGLCYQQKGRFSGSIYHPVLKRVEKFLGAKLPKALEVRTARAERLHELEEAVNAAAADLKQRGFESPYLKAFVVARINPLRFKRGAKSEFDETMDKMITAAKRFDAGKVRADQVARTGGAPEG
jgi:ParB family chromosome partitioning protein